MLPDPTDAARGGPHPGRPWTPGTLPHPASLAGKRIRWEHLERVLVVRPDNLGDVLLLGPALRALRAAAPRASLTLLGSPAGAAVAPLLPELDRVLVASPIWQDAGPPGPPDPQATLALAEQIRAGRFDAAVILTSFSQSPHPAAYVCLLAGIPVRAAMSREFAGGVLTHWVPAPEVTQHQADRPLQLLAALGVPIPADRPGLHAWLAPGCVSAARRTVGLGETERYVALLPGASCASRRWAPERFAVLARALAESELSVVVAGSAREAALVADVAELATAPASWGRQTAHPAGTGRILTVAGDLNVPELAGLLSGADAAVTNNSGGMHLADAVGAPLVVLFAGTELVEEYAPRSTAAVVLRQPTLCTPCRAFRCPYGHECLDLEPATVLAAVHQLASQGTVQNPQKLTPVDLGLVPPRSTGTSEYR